MYNLSRMTRLHRDGKPEAAVKRKTQNAPVPDYIYEICRRLRAELTPSERTLWKALRSKHLGGLKFRRQHPLGRYIADFYCPSAGLVVEIDGLVHDERDQAQYDSIRDEELKSRDLRILRFTVKEVENELGTVLAKILRASTH